MVIAMSEIDPEFQACVDAMENMQAFLHHELNECVENEIREHLMACENCLDNFDIEQVITTLIQRSAPPVVAPDSLRIRTAAELRLHSED